MRFEDKVLEAETSEYTPCPLPRQYRAIMAATVRFSISIFDFPLAIIRSYLRNDFYYPLSDDEIEKISTFIRIDDSNKEKVGRIEINFDNKKIGEIPIFQENKKEDKKSIFHWFKKLFVW